MESDKYDIVGRPQAEGVPSMRQLRGMLRSLLEDRFKLTIHREKRESAGLRSASSAAAVRS